MTIDDLITKTTGEMNTLRQQIASIDSQVANLQQQREGVVRLYIRAEGALAVLQELKNEASGE